MFYHGYSLHPYYRQHNVYPPIDITFFQQSLKAYQTLLQHGSTVLNTLVSSPELMYRLMTAAQAGDHETVDRVIRATGVPTIVETSFTPNSVTFTLHADAQHFPHCCRLSMNLLWGIL